MLNWEDFAVKLEKKDIPRIAEILRAIPEEVVRAKQKACREVWTRFTWISPSKNPLGDYPREVQDAWAETLVEKDAFSSLMLALQKKMQKTNH